MNKWRTALNQARKECNFNSSPGIDGLCPRVFRSQWDEGEIQETIEREIMKGYLPQPLRKVEISTNGKSRVISIPTIKDRFVSVATLIITRKDLEGGLYPNSKGSTRGYGTAYSLMKVSELRRRYPIVLKLDIAKCFDEVNQDILMTKVGKGVEDKMTRSLISKMVRVNGKLGIPQGNPLCPSLINIYLQDFDDWVRSQGYEYVRYLDDILIFMDQPDHNFIKTIGAYLEKRLRMRINEKKSILIEKELVSFLGFSIDVSGSILADLVTTRQRADSILINLSEHTKFFLEKGTNDEAFFELKRKIRSEFEWLAIADNLAEVAAILDELMSKIFSYLDSPMGISNFYGSKDCSQRLRLDEIYLELQDYVERIDIFSSSHDWLSKLNKKLKDKNHFKIGGIG
jgi:retron-type reverse transcriptase